MTIKVGQLVIHTTQERKRKKTNLQFMLNEIHITITNVCRDSLGNSCLFQTRHRHSTIPTTILCFL